MTQKAIAQRGNKHTKKVLLKKNGQKQSAEQNQAENHVCKLVEAFLLLSKMSNTRTEIQKTS